MYKDEAVSDYQAGRLYAEDGNHPFLLATQMHFYKDPQEFVAGFMDWQFDQWLGGVGKTLRAIPYDERSKVMNAVTALLEAATK